MLVARESDAYFGIQLPREPLRFTGHQLFTDTTHPYVVNTIPPPAHIHVSYSPSCVSPTYAELPTGRIRPEAGAFETHVVISTG